MQRCTQCWQQRPAKQFIGARGSPVTWCASCRKRYRGKTYVRRGRPAALQSSTGPLRVGWTRCSGNRKTGRIPVSITSAETCPRACPLYGAGCYAEFGWLRQHWTNVPESGLTWGAFCAKVAALPPGTLWRHNEAGDLPGRDATIDVAALMRLVLANHGRRGFTFSHKPLRTHIARQAVRTANELGFTVNLSADNLHQADRLAALGIGPVAVVLPSDTPDRGTTTPAGRRVVVCPAETTEGMTCKRCQLCAKPQRKAIVGFRAHGQMAGHVSQLVQLKKVGRRGTSALGT